jgi:hypothetical protein
VLYQLGRGAVKRRQLVHAIEHNGARRHVARKIERHRRVVPHHRMIDGELDLHFDKQSTQFVSDGG